MATTDELQKTSDVPRRPEVRTPEAPWWLTHAALAAVAYVPLLFTSPGMVGADTKAYFYIDPNRLLQSAASMWTPSIGAGTVTHQNIGFLLPMGPFYWLFHHLGAPSWVAQRLWLGSLLFFAGSGVLYLLKVLGFRGAGRPVAALAFMLSPYWLEYAARISAILMPWAGLPWMLALAVLALRRGGWRYPAMFALVVALVGGVNATSLLYAGVAPVLWFPYAVLVTREATWKTALATVARMGVLTVAVSLWWVAGLYVEGAFNLNVLKYTETVKTVARTSLSSEVLRGLGYWFFYGQDKLGPWIQPAADYTQRVWLIGVSFALPTLAFVSAVLVRWRHRAYFVGLLLVGTVMGVGLYPFNDPTPLGQLLKSAATGSTVGLAMRSTGRAVPLVVLATAVLLGAGVSAVVPRLPSRGARLAVTGVILALVAADMFPLWSGTVIGGNLERPETIPAYWHQAANYLDTQGRNPGGPGYQSRVLGLPGEDFASYRWGNTVDPVLPGLMNRPYVAREVFPYGTSGTVDLLSALDSTLQEGTFVRSSLAPIARLMSAGDVLLQSDLQYERYNTARPVPTWALFNPPPPGLSTPRKFGAATPNVSVEFPLLDEIALAQPPNPPNPPPVATFPVPGARSIVRADPATQPVLVDGDGEGLVDAAPTGLLNTNAAVLYSPSMAGDPSGMRRALSAGAALLLTDTNRKQARRWSTVRENKGYTERAGEKPAAYDPSDERLPLFPAAGDSAHTVAEQIGVSSVVASGYGNPISYTPENQAASALDGNLRTAWRVADFDDPVGQWIRVSLTKPVTTDHVTLVQPLYGPRNRWMTRTTLTFDGGSPVTVDLGPGSRSAPGQSVTFPRRSFRTLQITVDDTNTGHRASYTGLSGVGFAEIGVPGVHMDQVIRLPEDMLSAAGTASLSHQLSIVMTRERSAPTPPRSDPETTIERAFSLPTARTFTLGGTARLSSQAPDNVIDQLTGQQTEGIVATSSGRLPGDVQDRASAAVDGNPGTFWSPPFGAQEGQWVEYDLPGPTTFEHMNLAVVADGRHSVPTRVEISTESGSRTVNLPPVTDRPSQDATANVPVTFAPISGRRVRVTIEGVRPVVTKEYYSQQPIVTPVGLAELGIAGIAMPPPPPLLPATCRSDLLTVDGNPLPVSVSGAGTTAETLGGLQVSPCGDASRGLGLGAGSHVLRSADGTDLGINLDQLTLASAPGGSAASVGGGGQLPTVSPSPPPTVHVVDQNSTVVHLRVRNPGKPFWLVLGQSQDKGWTATLSDGRSLGPSSLMDGYANGWYVSPHGMPATLDVTLRFAPQNWVWLALCLSAIAILFCLGLVVALRRRDRDRPARTEGGSQPRLTSPLLSSGSRPRVGAVVLATLAAAFGAAVLISPWAALLIGPVVLAGLLFPRARLATTLPATGLLAVTGLYMVVEQLRYRYPPEFEWPINMTLGNTLAWLALALLVADVVVEYGRRGRPPPREDPPTDAGAEGPGARPPLRPER